MKRLSLLLDLNNWLSKHIQFLPVLFCYLLFVFKLQITTIKRHEQRVKQTKQKKNTTDDTTQQTDKHLKHS